MAAKIQNVGGVRTRRDIGYGGGACRADPELPRAVVPPSGGDPSRPAAYPYGRNGEHRKPCEPVFAEQGRTPGSLL